MDSAMDDIPLFSPAGDQAWQAYLCHKRQMLVSIVSAKMSAVLLCYSSAAMDYISFFSPAGVQAWLAYYYLNDLHIVAAVCRRPTTAAPAVEGRPH
jgi:hypothetical protein